jgi:hypothetical protein
MLLQQRKNLWDKLCMKSILYSLHKFQQHNWCTILHQLPNMSLLDMQYKNPNQLQQRFLQRK